MKVSQNQNILYKDRISHKQKSVVTNEKFSQDNYFRETPLKRDVNDISFKGVFSLYNVKRYNLKQNLDFLSKYIGKAPVELEQNFQKSHWNDIRDHIKDLPNGKVEVRTKNWTRLLMEGVVYPVTELPIYIANSLKKTFTGTGFNTQKATLEEMNKRSFLQKKFDILNNSDIVNSFSGYMETAEKLKYDTPDVQSSGLFTRAMKMFDPKSGNYNGVHERALTRIVTGFIPAFFLANDAYNLSRLCDDDPKAAEKEKKARFNQETKRVLSNAYLQLITLGALSKYINSKKWVFMLVTALTVIATESFSRLSNGKKIKFINKEEAIKLNKELAEREDKKEGKAVNETVERPVKEEKIQPSFKGSKVFQAFGLASDMPITAMDMSGKTVVFDKRREIKESKPLLTLSSITKWFVGVVIAGFALKSAKKNVKINGAQLGKYFNVVSKKYDRLYEKLTTENYKLSRDKFNQIINKLKSYDEVLGKKFEDVTLQYQKTSKLNKEAANIAETLEQEGLTEFAEMFRHLSNKGKTSSFADINVQSAADSFFKNRNNKIIEANVNKFLAVLKSNSMAKEAEDIENILYENNKFNVNNFTKAKKFLENHNELKPFITTFENRFKVNNDAENLKMFNSAMTALKEKNEAKANELTSLIENAVNAEEYTFGRRNIKGVRQIADFVTQPFKFMWGTITLPYKHIAKPMYNAIKQEYKLPEWDKELDAVYNGINKLTYKSKFKPNSKAKIDLTDEQFASYMNKRINKAFNTSTMSSISNSDLSALAKNTSTAATAWFLMADNHNMVMQKSNGQDKEGAILKAKERAIQETSRTFYNVLFINLFNDTFRNTYNSSLLGAQAVNFASTLIGEYTNRKLIGMPVKALSRDEILNKEYENITSKGAKGGFFRFMSRLTGKKVLSQRENSKK